MKWVCLKWGSLLKPKPLWLHTMSCMYTPDRRLVRSPDFRGQEVHKQYTGQYQCSLSWFLYFIWHCIGSCRSQEMKCTKLLYSYGGFLWKDSILSSAVISFAEHVKLCGSVSQFNSKIRPSPPSSKKTGPPRNGCYSCSPIWDWS